MKKFFTLQSQSISISSKSVNYISFVVIALLLSFSFNGFCNRVLSYNLHIEHSAQLTSAIDPILSLEIVMDNSKRILRVSFNGEEGQEGVLKIYDLLGELVKESNFELIKSPFFASVDITELTKGSYRVELTTNKNIHNSNIEIK